VFFFSHRAEVSEKMIGCKDSQSRGLSSIASKKSRGDSLTDIDLACEQNTCGMSVVGKEYDTFKRFSLAGAYDPVTEAS